MTNRRPLSERRADQRIAPGTAVTFFAEGHRRSGRVVNNLPGLNGKPPTIIIKDTNGQRWTVARTVVSSPGDWVR